MLRNIKILVKNINQICTFRKYFSKRKFGSENFFDISKALVRHPAVNIRRIFPEDKPNILHFLRNNFHESEVLVPALHMPPRNYSAALEELWCHYMDQGLSLVAVPGRHSNYSTPFGVIINNKYCKWDSDYLHKFCSCCQCPYTRKLIQLYAIFIKESQIHKQFDESIIFNVVHLVINGKESLRNNINLNKEKISFLLLQKSLRLAYANGYKVASLICANKKLEKIAQKNRMQLTWKIPCKQFLNENLNPTIDLPDKCIKVYVRKFSKINN